ncbi:Ptprq [Columba guinea]|nr:Ptprq [Columba guinea]
MFLLQGSESLDCDQMKKPTRVVLVEWTELPKGKDPDHYIVTYQRADALSQKNVRNISKFEQKPVSTTILLEENKKYDITIESIKSGQIISVKSFKTRNFLLAARNQEGAQTILSPILKVETRPLHSQKLEATYVSSAEIHLKWKPPQHSSSVYFHYYLINILDTETNIWEQLPVEKSKTSIVIGNVKPYHQYHVYLQNVAEKGTLSCYEKPILITTGDFGLWFYTDIFFSDQAVSPPTAVYIHPEDVQEESVILHWKLPQEGQESFIQVKPTADIGDTMKFLVSNTEEFKIDLLIPGMAYEIAVASVNNGNMSELKTIQCTLKPKPVQIVVPYMLYSHAVVLFVRMPDIGVFDGIYIASKGGPNATFVLKSDGKITIENLTAGTEYDFCISTKSGTMLSSFYHVSGVKTCLAAPLNVREGDITDTSIQIAWDRADGDFHQYEVTCINCANAFRVQKVKQETATFSNLTPGKLYNFTIRTEKEGFRDSISVTKEIETGETTVLSNSAFVLLFCSIYMSCFNIILIINFAPTPIFTTDPDPPSDLQVFGQEENTVYFSWKLPRGGYDMFQLSYYLTNNEKLLTRTVYDSRAVVKNLAPGTEYFFQLRTVKGLDSSMAVEKKVITKPAKPEGLKFFNVSAHSFSLYWRLPYGHVDRFLVDLIPDHGSVVILDLGVREYQADFSNTIPGTTYNVTVSAVSSSLYSSPASRTVTTNVTNPGPPVLLAGERVGSAGILLSWNTPLHPNGRILSYIVKYKEVAAENSAGVGVFSNPFLFQTAESAPGKVVNLTVEALNYSAVNLIWFLPRQPNGKITSFKISVKHARSGIVVKDVLVKVEDLLSGRLPECNDNSESFLWSTTTPSTTFGKSTIPSRTTVTPSMEAPSRTSSVWNEPISFVITNLRPYTTYLFEVSAVTTEAGYIDSAIVRTPESVPEDPPQNFAKSNITAKSFSVTWDPPTIVTGKFSYRVELYGPSGHILDNSTKDHKFVFSNLVPFTRYDVYVGAETSAGVGPKTNLTVFTPADVPGIVSDLHPTEVEATYIKIVWRKPRQPNGIITQYRVKVNVQETEVTLENTILDGKNKYFIDSLAPYMISENTKPSPTWNSIETTNELYEGSAEIFSNIQTTSPVIFTSVSGDNLLATNGATELHSASGDQYSVNILAEELSYVVKGLVPFTDYTISVSAFTAVGEGSPSVLMVRTQEQEPDSPPQNVELINVTATEINLRWLPPEQPNGLITHYEVLFSDSNDLFIKNASSTSISLGEMKPYTLYNISVRAFTRLGHGNQSSFPLLVRTSETDLKKYTEYTVEVSASTTIGEGLLSAPLHILTDEDAPSSPPESLSVKQLSGVTVKLSWKPPLEPNGIILYYTVYVWNKMSKRSANVTETSLEFRDLENNSEYSAYLTASTRFGDGNIKSDVITFRTSEGAPSDPPKDVVYRNLTSTSIRLFWSPPQKPNGNIRYYSVYFKNNSGIFIQNFTSYGNDSNVDVSQSAVLDGLAKYSHYTLWLTASTAFGDGNKTSEIIDVYTDQDIPESAPIIKTFFNLSTTSVMLSWDPPVKPSGVIISYDLHLFGPERNNSFSTTNNFIILEDLLPFTLYSIYAAARTIKGPGPSAMLQFYTDESVPLAPPQNLTITNYTADSVWLKWDPSPQPNGVIMRYSFKIYQNNTKKLLYQNISGSSHEANLVGLEPFSPYFISVSAFTRLGNGNQFSNAVQFTTMESVPDAVQNVHCLATSWQSIQMQWDPPASSNGVITHYVITVEGNTTIFSAYDTLHTFRNLPSNFTYQFKIKAATSAGEGEEQICNASTLPEKVPSAPRDIVFSNVQSTSVTLNWRSPKSILGYFQNYKITTQLQSIHCSDWETKDCIESEIHQYLYENVVDDRIEETVYGLKKYRWYRFTVAASTNVGYGSSSPWISTQTLPGSPDGPPENVTVLATSPHSINISWSEPLIITGPTCYLIDITSVDNDNYKAQFLKTNDETKVLEISDLKAFTRYSVVIIAFTGDVTAALLEGKASSPVIVSTFEAVPEDPPNNITFQKIPDEVTKFQVTFVPPSEPNGNIQVYQAVVYNEDDPAATRIHNLSVIDKTDQSVTAMIEGLKGGHTYNVSVYAINGAGAGPKIQLKITMDIKEPPRPKKKPAPVYDTDGALLVTATTITIRMPICYYNDDHGPIKKIQVLVVEAGAQHDGNVTKWYDAYFNRPRPYFTNDGFPNPPCIEGKENLSGKEEIYIIGADTTCMISGSQDKICNGPLKPRKQYLFKFRATNIKGQFTDSDYSDPVKTLGEGMSGRSVEVILAVTLCILSVVLLVAAVYAFARIRQKQKEGGTYSPRDAEIIDTKFKLDQLITVADLELKDERFTRYSSFFFRRKEIFVIQLLSYRKSIKPISKKSFLQHVEELCTNNNLKFQEEFSELPKFLEDLASTDADLPWNRSKNRFPNIKPYNNNRVKLMPDAAVPGSDYINASYVSGYLCPNEFIATQGPLPGTVGDFWRMVWETRAKTLVMLTQCFEKGRIRCHQYWPEDNKPVTVFGDIVITKLMEDTQIDWTIRDLKIERHGDCMMVRQCNFTSWPEHGVPETTAPIIHFVKLIRASRAHDNTPMVVHCSAGVGRTGVYIALDHLTQHINDHDFVDIYGLVAELRSERMCMVQNLAQYIFLHQCVLDLLASKGSSQPICFVNYSALQKMDSLDAMEGDVELEWEETTM